MPTPREPITLSDDGRDAWDRQPGETAKRWGQFTIYRDLGRTRTLKRVAERLNITHRSAQQYAYVYRWNPRCEAFDRHLDEQWIAALHEHRRRMVQDHLKLTREFHAKALEAIQGLVAQTLSPADTVRVAETYSKLIRFALGEPDQNVSLSGRADQPAIRFSHVPGDQDSLRAEMEEAVKHLAHKLGATGTVDPYDVLELPD